MDQEQKVVGDTQSLADDALVHAQETQELADDAQKLADQAQEVADDAQERVDQERNGQRILAPEPSDPPL
jgi:hypothetical protein